MLPAAVIDPLSRFLDEEDGRGALQAATAALCAQPIDTAELLDWVQAQLQTDVDRRRQAISALRAALGLHVIPGPMCRSA